MKKTLIPFFILILIVSLACDIVISPGEVQDPVGSAVAATQTAQGGAATPEPPPTPTAEGSTPADTPAGTPAPACQPVHPGPQALPLPLGVAAGFDEVVTVKNTEANLLATRPVGGMTFMESDRIHLAGNFALGADSFPIVYFTLQGGDKLRLNENNLLSDLAPAPNLVSMAGAEGDPFLAYVAVDMMDQSTNRLYAGDFHALSGAQPILTWIPSQGVNIGNAIHPLAVHRSGGSADGLWFTYTMWGIGNLNYPPYNGLFFLDLATAQGVEYIGPADALGGISPDQTMIAYGAGQGGTPGLIQGGVTIRNLISCQETYIPFNPASNLGGGWMVFSPDNQFIAWTEAGGPNNAEATFRMRVARTNGVSLFDAPTASMTSLLGGEPPTVLRPVGWVANHLVIVEAYLPFINRAVLVVWAPDPSQPLNPVLGANQSAPINDGTFLGFVYP
jgi:hypothetical protein